MAMLRFLFRRLMAQRLLALGVVLTMAFSVGVMASGPIYTDASRESILTSTIATATVPTKNVRVDLYGDPTFDLERADTEVRQAAKGLPVHEIVSQGQATVRVGPEGAPGTSVPMLFRDGSEDHLTFLDGRAPHEREIALPSGIADSDALHVGDDVEVLGPSNEGATLSVSGIFEPPAAPTDPFWFGEDTPFPFGNSEEPVPVVVDRSTATDLAGRIDLTTHFVWDVYLDLTGLTYAQAQDVSDRYVAFGNAIDQSVTGGTQAAHVTSGIAVLVARVQRSVADLRVPILLVLAQILVVTLVVLAGVGVLLVTRQSFELAVMHSRGFTTRSLLAVQGLQAVLAAAIAFPFGIAIGTLLARFAGATNGPRPDGSGLQIHLSAGSLAFGAVTAAVGAIVLALPSIPATRRTILDERRQTSREGRPALSRAPLELIVLPVGIFALAQLRGGVAAATAGEGSIDPLLLFGPTLVILGASFLVVRAISWGLGALDGRIGRSRRLSTYLAGRRLGRAPGVAFASAILIVLSVGLLFIATSYRATTLQNHADAAHAFVGTDRVVGVGAPASGPEGFGRPLPDHMSAAAQVSLTGFHGSYTNGPDGLAVDPATFADASWWRSDFADEPLATLMDRLRPPPIGAEVPAGSHDLSVTIDAPFAARGYAFRASYVRADGEIVTTEPTTVSEGRHTYVVATPGATRLLSLTFNRPSAAGADAVTMRIAVTTADGRPVPLDGWTGLETSGSTGDVAADGDAWRFTGHFAIGSQIVGLQPKPAAVPAIVSSDVGGQEPLDVDLQVGPTVIPVHVVGTADAFPSFTPGTAFVILSGPALFDLEGAVPDTVERVDQVWVRGGGEPTAAIEAAGLPVTGELSATQIEGQLAEAPQSLAVGLDAAAAIAGLGLVIAGVTATLYFAQRRREFEFASLRAMGAGATTVRDTIAREQIALVGVASLAGIALGYAVLRLASAPLLDAVNTTFPTPVVVVDVRAVAVALVVIGVAAAAAAAAAARAAIRAPITAVLRGDPE
jgi:ABC-type antimicrobial peptide transport system permease subunit